MKQPEFTGYEDCVCDRHGVCPFLGGCFLENEIVKSMPPYMNSQIKNATSPKKALQILKSKKYFNEHRKKDSQGQRL